MATCRDIITDAMRYTSIISLSDMPEADEATHGLLLLQSYYDSLFKGGPLTPQTEKLIDTDYTPEGDERITLLSGTVTLPVTVELGGEKRAPYEFTPVVVVSEGAETNYVYCAGAWQTATGLALGDVAPLSSFDRMGLACHLGQYLATVFGADMRPATMMLARRFNGKLLNRGPKYEPEYY